MTDVKRHPFRGLIGGLCAGVGATVLLIAYAKAPFGQATAWIPLLVLVVVGVLIGLFAPPRGHGETTDVSPPPPPPPTTPSVTEAESPDAG